MRLFITLRHPYPEVKAKSRSYCTIVLKKGPTKLLQELGILFFD
jgi:hypothetical protein